LPDNTDPADLITNPADIAVLRAALTDQARPLAEAVIDIRLGALIERHPDLLRWPEGRVSAARTLSRLIINQPADQIVALTAYITERTDLSLDTVALVVIANLERLPQAREREVSTNVPVIQQHPSAFPQRGTTAIGLAPNPAGAPSHRPPRRSR
jgi:hypothetical protein